MQLRVQSRPLQGPTFGAFGLIVRRVRTKSLIHPISDEDIRLSADFSVAVGCEDDLLAIAREHRKAVEFGAVGDPLQVSAVDADHPELELAPLFVTEIRSEDNALAVGVEEWSERARAQVGDSAVV